MIAENIKNKQQEKHIYQILCKWNRTFARNYFSLAILLG
jgi:hypothetical protein